MAPSLTVYLLSLSTLVIGASQQNYFSKNWAEKSKSVGDAKSAAEFITDWRRRLSVLLQNCNSKVILKKIARLSQGHSEMDKFRDRSVQFTIH